MAKLRIQPCKVSGSKITPKGGKGDIFEAVINPESYTHSFGLQYTGGEANEDAPIGNAAPVMKYAMADPEKINFTIIVDGTGVVPDKKKQTVAKQIEKLRKVVYDYDGDEHETTPVKIMWGKGLKAFYGRLTSMTIDYTLFHPNGEPLRAKIKMDFVQALTRGQEALEAKRKSPDLTHVVQVREGDTLPMLCHRIYKDASAYLKIAAFNDLDNFRRLTPGTLLRFPPMRERNG